ncbi:hypothetical protein Tco_1361219 [Tanacetum coccineum]
MGVGQLRNSMRLKGESKERPRARLESQKCTCELLRLSQKYNDRSAKNISDAKDFGPTTEKDGNINLVKEVVDPNGQTNQIESQSALLLNYLKTNLTGSENGILPGKSGAVLGSYQTAAEAEAATMSISKRAIPDATTVAETNEIVHGNWLNEIELHQQYSFHFMELPEWIDMIS